MNVTHWHWCIQSDHPEWCDSGLVLGNPTFVLSYVEKEYAGLINKNHPVTAPSDIKRFAFPMSNQKMLS